MRAVQVRVGAVQRAHPPVDLVAEDVGREQRRREQHEGVQRRDRRQHGARRELVGRAHGERVAAEHQREHARSHADDVEVERRRCRTAPASEAGTGRTDSGSSESCRRPRSRSRARTTSMPASAIARRRARCARPLREHVEARSAAGCSSKVPLCGVAPKRAAARSSLGGCPHGVPAAVIGNIEITLGSARRLSVLTLASASAAAAQRCAQASGPATSPRARSELTSCSCRRCGRRTRSGPRRP